MDVANAAKHVALGLSAWAACVDLENDYQLRNALKKVQSSILPSMILQSLLREALTGMRTTWSAAVRDRLVATPRLRPMDSAVCLPHHTRGCLCAPGREDPDAHAILDTLRKLWSFRESIYRRSTAPLAWG